MNLYLWQLENEDCTCYYGIVEHSLVEARKKVIQMLEKQKSFCVSCIDIGDGSWENLSFEEKLEHCKQITTNTKERLIDYINNVEPMLYKEGIPFERNEE